LARRQTLGLAVLKKKGSTYKARKLSSEELQEQEQHISEIEKRIWASQRRCSKRPRPRPHPLCRRSHQC